MLSQEHKMKISDVLVTTFPSFSFEFYAPETGEGVPKLLDTVARLKEPGEPRFGLRGVG